MSLVRNIQHVHSHSRTLQETVEIKGDFSLLGKRSERELSWSFLNLQMISYNSSTRKSLPRAVFKGVDSMI